MKVKTSLDVASNKITSLATPTADTDAATKAYVDTTASAGTPDADATTKGKIQLAGDLSGTAASPAIASGAVTSTKIADGTIVNADVSASAAIAYSKLSLSGSIVNADVSASAAIAYSKLTLTGSIVNADVAAGAAIALSKLATDPLARANHTGTQTASTISDLATVVKAYRLDEFAVPTADISLNSKKITSLATPTASTDAATKGYVDGAAGGGGLSDLLLIGA